MRWWGIVAIPCIVIGSSAVAHAQAPSEDVATTGQVVTAPEPPEPPEPEAVPRLGYGAMPGGLHVPSAEILPRGSVAVAALSGYGYRKGLLSAGHTFNRMIGDLAFAYAPLPSLMLGLSLDGRYDRHRGFRPDVESDDNYVGDPHVMVRFARPLGRASLGAQLGIWLPGKDAPSVAASAISADARGLLTVDAGFGTLSLHAGFRFDNSAKSVDMLTTLSFEDRVSLGISDFHAALGGVALRIPLGPRAYVSLEGSTDVFVGDDAPAPILRGGAIAGIAVTDALTVVGFLEAAKVPQPEADDVMARILVQLPYEPTVTGGIGLQARFGRPRRAPASQVEGNEVKQSVIVLETADINGLVVDDSGKPVVGAEVRVKLKNHTGKAVTDDKGTYSVAQLPIGKTVDGKTELDDTGAEVSVEVATKKPGSTTLTLARGANAVPNITLEPLLPPGQLRAVITNVGSSKRIAGATVTIEPGGVTVTSGPDGKFTVDLPPGQYKLTVTAKGLAQQQLDVTIDPNGVAIKNIDMHK
jgi:Carboxypeptidase regulatory-like domain